MLMVAVMGRGRGVSKITEKDQEYFMDGPFAPILTWPSLINQQFALRISRH